MLRGVSFVGANIFGDWALEIRSEAALFNAFDGIEVCMFYLFRAFLCFVDAGARATTIMICVMRTRNITPGPKHSNK